MSNLEVKMMIVKPIIRIATALLFIWSVSAHAQGDEFDPNKLLSELESQLKLSTEKLSEMKPVIDAKSAELKTVISKSVDKGFVELEKLTTELESGSRRAQEKLQQALSSEEMQQLHDSLKKWDREAIEQTRQELAVEVALLLELTQDQVNRLKPIIADSFKQLGEMLDTLVKQGDKNLEEFGKRFEELSEDLNQKLRDNLSSDQMQTLKMHRDDLNEKIKERLFGG